MENVIFSFYRGDTYTRNIVIKGLERKITKIYFTAKKDVENKNASLQKKLNDGITIVEENQDGVIINILINATDTDSLDVDVDYVFDIEIHCNDFKRTIVTGFLRLKPSSTRTYNEI